MSPKGYVKKAESIKLGLNVIMLKMKKINMGVFIPGWCI